MLAGYQQRNFSAPIGRSKISHDVYWRGDQGPTVVIIQELPGIGPETLSLADQLSDQGYRVVLPHLFGPLGRISLLGNLGRVFCMRKEFKLFAKNASSPIVDWLRALCKDLKENQQATAIGVIGMCLTGNFSISMMADDNVLAGVASQSSMPLNSQSDLHMSADDIEGVRSRLNTHGPMLAMRFKGDRLCTAKKFRAIDEAFNDDVERVRLIELPGAGHSVLTLDFAKRAEVTDAALASVLEYFDSKLKAP